MRNEAAVDALALMARPTRIRDGSATCCGAGTTTRSPSVAVRGRGCTGRAGIERRLLVQPGDFGTSAFTIEEVEVAPDVSDDWHRHPQAEHAIVVFEGRGVVHVGDIEETLEPLKGIRVVAGRPHRVVNLGARPGADYVCSSPGTDPMIDRQPAEAPRRLDA